MNPTDNTPAPSATEIEAFCRRWANGRLHGDMAADFAATIATLTARAEAADVRHAEDASIIMEFSQRIEALTARAEQAEAKPGMTLGVGDGSGQLFVHGDYDSIKAAQAIIFRAKRLAARVATLEAANGKLREMLGRAGGLLGQFYEHHGWTPVGREVIAIIGKATTPRDGGGNG